MSACEVINGKAVYSQEQQIDAMTRKHWDSGYSVIGHDSGLHVNVSNLDYGHHLFEIKMDEWTTDGVHVIDIYALWNRPRNYLTFITAPVGDTFMLMKQFKRDPKIVDVQDWFYAL